MKKLLLFPLILSGCVVPEQDNRICLDWATREVIREKCIPMYGTLICADEQRIETYCILYDTIEIIKEEENASEVQTK